MFLSASSTPSLREKKIWQNEQTLWPHIYTTNVEICRLWHDILRFFVHFLEKKIFLLKRRKCLFTVLAPQNRNRKTLKLFFLFNQWLSIRSFGRRDMIQFFSGCDTLETVMHYHQNPYVRNITGLHRNYEHKRQIKDIKDCFITWKMI